MAEPGTTQPSIPPPADGGQRLLRVLDLVPTQVTIGIREMEHKRRRWRERSADEAAAYLASRPVPVVVGPDRRCHMIDRHHFVRAVYEEGVEQVPAVVLADLGTLDAERFWRTLEQKKWAHPFDEAGWRRLPHEMPRTVLDLRDDVFRSLAGALKRAGGYAKAQSPFSEFRWAHFLRSRIPEALVQSNFDCALARALELSRGVTSASPPAAHSPPGPSLSTRGKRDWSVLEGPAPAPSAVELSSMEAPLGRSAAEAPVGWTASPG